MAVKKALSPLKSALAKLDKGEPIDNLTVAENRAYETWLESTVKEDKDTATVVNYPRPIVGKEEKPRIAISQAPKPSTVDANIVREVSVDGKTKPSKGFAVPVKQATPSKGFAVPKVEKAEWGKPCWIGRVGWFTHTKHGTDHCMFAMPKLETLLGCSKEEGKEYFKALAEFAKSLGGGYSPAFRETGKPGGFAFDTAEQCQAFIEALIAQNPQLGK